MASKTTDYPNEKIPAFALGQVDKIPVIDCPLARNDASEKIPIPYRLAPTAVEKIPVDEGSSLHKDALGKQAIASGSACILNYTLQPSNVFQIYLEKDHNLSVRLVDKETPVYWVGRQGSLCEDNSMYILTGDPNGPPIAQVTAHTSLSDRERDTLDIQWLGTEIEGLTGGKVKTVHMQRDTNILGRRHKLQLSDGQTYFIEGATSKCILSYWGDLKMVDANKQPVADFRCVWWRSWHKVGTITVHGNPEPNWVEEVVMAILAVAHKEYRFASQCLWEIPGEIASWCGM